MSLFISPYQIVLNILSFPDAWIWLFTCDTEIPFSWNKLFDETILILKKELGWHDPADGFHPQPCVFSLRMVFKLACSALRSWIMNIHTPSMVGRTANSSLQWIWRLGLLWEPVGSEPFITCLSYQPLSSCSPFCWAVSAGPDSRVEEPTHLHISPHSLLPQFSCMCLMSAHRMCALCPGSTWHLVALADLWS